VAVAFGETFEALVAGLQGALWALGSVPAVLRSDNLSAATHELKHSSGRDLTARFRAVLEHYGMRSSRITPGRAHENGDAEKAHRRLKAVVAQALVWRGHADFATLAAYEAFVRDAVDRGSHAVAERVSADRAALRPLPSTAIPSYTIYLPVVRRWSTIRVAHRTYSVPARLMGHTVEARVHADLVEVRYRGQALRILKTWRETVDDSPWVFPSRKKGPHIAHAQKAIERIVRTSGVQFRGHDLRRTAASLMVGAGVPRLVVSKILNHVETGVTAVYDRHGYDLEKRAALDFWGKRLDQIVSGKRSKVLAFVVRG
jgi:hypothetical protein